MTQHKAKYEMSYSELLDYVSLLERALREANVRLPIPHHTMCARCGFAYSRHYGRPQPLPVCPIYTERGDCIDPRNGRRYGSPGCEARPVEQTFLLPEGSLV